MLGVKNSTKGKRVLFSVEGTSSYGQILTSVLQKLNIDVVEAKPKRKKERQANGKTDAIDATYAATQMFERTKDQLVYPKRGSKTKALKVLLASREQLVRQNVASKNMLLSILRTTNVEVSYKNKISVKVLNQCVKLKKGDDELENIVIDQIIQFAKRILSDNKRIKDNEKQLLSIIKDVCPNLVNQKGIGAISAANILYAYGHKGRFKNYKAFVKSGGFCPIPVSSGNTNKFRLSRYGDRRLNSAISTVATYKMIHDEDTIEYVDKRTREGKNKREIKRMLKTYIARMVFRILERQNIVFA